MTSHDELKRMLSAFLDDELTQVDGQRVRIHLEDCAECRQAFAEIKQLRQLTSQIEFVKPSEETMRELRRRMSIRAPRGLGWGFILGGALAWVVYAAYLLVTDPPALTVPNLIAGALVIGSVLLLVSVVQERWLERPHDRYRGVRK